MNYPMDRKLESDSVTEGNSVDRQKMLNTINNVTFFLVTPGIYFAGRDSAFSKDSSVGLAALHILFIVTTAIVVNSVFRAIYLPAKK